MGEGDAVASERLSAPRGLRRWRWAGPVRCGVGAAQERGSAARAELERAGWAGREKGRREWAAGSVGLGSWVWVLLSGWAGFWVWVRVSFFSLFPSIFLVQTNTQLGEFKFKIEFTTSTQTIKIMHQHECNNKVQP